MKNYLKTAVAILAIIVFGYLIYSNRTESPASETPQVVTEDDIVGCYAIDASSYLKILSQDGNEFKGTLVFAGSEVGSSGSFEGIYKDGILLGDYSVQSYPTREVIFKKLGTGFVLGRGSMNPEGTRFADLNKITYDTSYTFEPTADCATPK